jgi:hypothetical protein
LLLLLLLLIVVIHSIVVPTLRNPIQQLVLALLNVALGTASRAHASVALESKRIVVIGLAIAIVVVVVAKSKGISTRAGRPIGSIHKVASIVVIAIVSI